MERIPGGLDSASFFHSACDIGSDALLLQLISLSAYKPGLKQIEFAAAICSLDSGNMIAGRTAASSFVTPRVE
jgi:hypothetical protein